MRKESTSYVSPPAESVPRSGHSAASPGIQGNLHYEAASVNGAVQYDVPHQELDSSDQGMDNITPSADLDFDLIWPDTEELFHTIMSTDTPWQMPLTTLPFPPGVHHQHDNHVYGTPSSFDDRASSVGSIPSGSGHQAVHDVSRMVTSLVSLPNGP